MQQTISETLNLLERRLARVEFYLGSSHESESDERTSNGLQPEEPVKSRLARLEARFAEVCSKYPTSKELLDLNGRHPEIVSRSGTEQEFSSSTAASKQQVVLSSASAYSNAVSSLNTLQESPLPDAGNMAALVALQPRLQRVQTIQEAQMQEVEELKQRSAALLLQWYQGTVLDRGEQWVDVEEGLTKMEQIVRRKEKANEREREEI